MRERGRVWHTYTYLRDDMMKWTTGVTEPTLAGTEFSGVVSSFRDVEEFED